MKEQYENAEWHVEVNGEGWDYGTFETAETAQAAYQDYFNNECDESGDYKNGDTEEQEIDLVLTVEGAGWEVLERKTVTVYYECYHGDLQEHGTHWRGL